MGTPYVGEIRMVAFGFAPFDWFLCNGQLLQISQFETLFQLIGTTYGGDGQSTFALPNLQSRVPMHQGSVPSLGTYVLAQTGGFEMVTLTTQQIPAHNHSVQATNAGAAETPSSSTLPAVAPPNRNVYGPAGSGPATMAPGMISPAGGSQPHNNIQPYLCINFIISPYGIFPSQN